MHGDGWPELERPEDKVDPDIFWKRKKKKPRALFQWVIRGFLLTLTVSAFPWRRYPKRPQVGDA
jgi:hypothetical protein